MRDCVCDYQSLYPVNKEQFLSMCMRVCMFFAAWSYTSSTIGIIDFDDFVDLIPRSIV